MNLYFWGFVVLIVSSSVFPMKFRNFNAALPIAGLLCCLWFIELLIWRRRSLFKPSRVVIATLTFVTIALLSLLIGQYPWISSPGAPLGAQIAGLGLMVVSIGLFLVAGHRIRHIFHLQWLTWLFILVGGLFCISQIVPVLGFTSSWSNSTTVGSMFWVWLIAMAFSQALFNRDLSGAIRITFFCVAILGLYRGLFLAASWASGWMPSLVAVAVILLFLLPRTFWGIGVLTIPGIVYGAGRIMDLLLEGEEYSFMTRLEALRVLLHLFEKNPIIGLGPSNYHYYTPLYPILGWYVKFNSHNNYMDILLQTGILGLLAFIWFLFEIILLILKLLRSIATDCFRRAYLIGAMGGIIGSIVSGMLADWIIPFYYNIGLSGFRSSFLFWFFLGGVLALKRMTSRNFKAPSVARFSPA